MSCGDFAIFNDDFGIELDCRSVSYMYVLMYICIQNILAVKMCNIYVEILDICNDYECMS